MSAREYWERNAERDISIAAHQPAEYLALQVIQNKQRWDFVRERFPEIDQFCQDCGHWLWVHTHLGCTGLEAGGNHSSHPDSSCLCTQWVPPP